MHNSIFKAFIPLLTLIYIVAIFSLILVMNITGIKYVPKIIMFVQIVGFLGCTWIPIANPIVGIWINRPYRDATKIMFARLFKKNSATTVQPLNQ
jgi:hypothetical protein